MASPAIPSVLIADDERQLRETLVRFFRSIGMTAVGVATADEAFRAVSDRERRCDLLVCDMQLTGAPGDDGVALLTEVRRRRSGIPVIILTGHASVQSAVDAMRAGAANFLVKPVNLDDLEQAVRAALAGPMSAGGSSRVDPRVQARSGEVFLGESGAAQELRQITRRVAQSDATVLITGESGAGKEVIARSIHAQSRRARMPFVAVNCGAIPEALMESELFGHVKGAFTGATQSRVGRFAAAAAGTLLLDEVGELALHLQVKLLRVLQERAFTPLGAAEALPMTARVLAATNRDLEAMVAAGQFREDLYYRLNVIKLHVPPLRDRGDDILELARNFLRRAAAAETKNVLRFDDDVTLCLKNYAWPGNVRELEHAMTQATVMAPGETLTLADLPVRVRAAFFASVVTVPLAPVGSGSVGVAGATSGPMPVASSASTPEAPPPLLSLPPVGETGVDLDATLAHVERLIVLDVLRLTGGNKNRAAALLRLPRTTFLERMKRLGL